MIWVITKYSYDTKSKHIDCVKSTYAKAREYVMEKNFCEYLNGNRYYYQMTEHEIE